MATEAKHLQPFCSTEAHRPELHRPWTRGAFTFATNGHIAVRVPAIPGVSDVGAAPNADFLWADQPSTFYSAPVANLRDEIITPCPRCDGDTEEPVHDCPCCECKCPACDGKGETLRKAYALLNGVAFRLKHLKQAWSMPGLTIAAPNEDQRWHFKFDGGEGCIMPLRLRALGSDYEDSGVHIVLGAQIET
jgi:hypothetical protein